MAADVQAGAEYKSHLRVSCDRCFAVLAALQTPEDARDGVTACADTHLQPGVSTISNALQLLPFQGPALAALQTEGAPKTLRIWPAATIQLVPSASGTSHAAAAVCAVAADTKSDLHMPRGRPPAESLLNFCLQTPDEG